MWPDTKAGRLLAGLEKHYGRVPPPGCSGPFEMVLWEIVTYLAYDAQRGSGVRPADILAAPLEVLREITRMDRLRLAAKLGDLDAVLRLPFQKAKNALMKYPMIGEPGAEKILLFCVALPALALESKWAPGVGSIWDWCGLL